MISGLEVNETNETHALNLISVFRINGGQDVRYYLHLYRTSMTYILFVLVVSG